MRHPDAQTRLSAFAFEVRGRRFAWGEMDCALLAFAAFDALTGGDLYAAYRGHWRNELGALRFQRRYGIDAARVLEAVGCREASLDELKRGDLIVVPSEGFMTAHVAFGGRCLSAPRGDKVGWCWTGDVIGSGGARALRVPE